MEEKAQNCFGGEDTDLVSSARLGDSGAFAELIRLYYDKCVRVARCILHDHAEAEDAAQVACLRAYRKLWQFREEAEFSTWLVSIVENHALDLLRSRKKNHAISIDETARGPRDRPGEWPAPGPNPEHMLYTRELRDRLRDEIKRLPSMYRSIIILRDLWGLPLEDISVKLGITVQAAKSRQGRARRELRNRLIESPAFGRPPFVRNYMTQ